MPHQHPDPAGPCSSAFPPYIPAAFKEDMTDKLACLQDVQQSYELLGELLDPLAQPAPVTVDMRQFTAMLRILNGTFARHMASAERMLSGA